MNKTSSKMKSWKTSHQLTVEANLEKIKKGKAERLFLGFAIADLAIEVAKISLLTGIKGTNFRNPKMTMKLDKVESMLQDIQKSELGQVVNLHPDYVDVMQNEHALEIYRWFTLMAFYPTSHLQEFNDGTEKMHEEGKSGIQPEPVFTKEDLEYFFHLGIDHVSAPLMDFNSYYLAFLEGYQERKENNG